MTSFACAFPSCNKPVTVRGAFCAEHTVTGKQMRARANAFYDQHQRNPEAKAFYNSKPWKIARETKMAEHPICQRCGEAWGEHVHHVIPLAECTDEQKVAQDNLRVLCQPCHNTEEAEIARGVESSVLPFVSGMLEPVEDDRFYFDEAAAEKPIKFIEKHCRHTEGDFAGQSFLLLDWQKQMVRTLFGWKHKAGHMKDKRRFRELYLITAKGAGKTPLLAAIGLYMLLADKEAAAHVISMASTVEQAHYTFDAGQNYVNESEILSADPRIRTLQHETEGPNYAKWTTISGEPNGRSGSKPSCLIADEVHEWSAGTAKGFGLVARNMFKRAQPLILMATNAAETKTGYAWQCHERAVAVLSGKSDDATLLPVIFEAPRELDWKSEDAARAANPSLGHFRHFDDLKPEIAKGDEAEYRRLYLSQWVSGSQKWLDMDEYDACARPVPADAVKDLPLYVGLDLSNGDDLCAAVFCYASPEHFYLQPWFWLPRQTAEHYEDKNNVPYVKWGCGNHIELLKEPTISTTVQERIADAIIAVHQISPITAVCYDAAYSSNAVARLKEAGIECRPVRQAWNLRDGTAEFGRRLKERSMTVEPNPVMRYCAENAEIKTDTQGNSWPVKPNAKGRYAGYRAAKIDGITAAVTAITEARQHDFPKDKPEKKWDGLIAVA